MKADSVIFTGVQKPLTLFGLPPQLFVLNAAGSAMVFGLFVAIDLVPLALIAAITVFLGTWAALFRRTRLDHHFANLVFTAPRFWRGHEVRRLVAGASLNGKGK